MSLSRLVTFTVTLSPSAKNGTGGILTTRVFEFNEGFQTFRETVNVTTSASDILHAFTFPKIGRAHV
jgi:hypothetical protein